MNISILISQMLQLFLIMLLGYIIYKTKVINDSHISGLSNLILTVTSPALVVASVLKLEERQATSDVITAFIISMALYFIIQPFFGFLLNRLLRIKKNNRGLYTFMTTYANISFMGFPVIEALLGATGLFYAAIFTLSLHLSVYTIGIYMVDENTQNTRKFDYKKLLSPGVLSSLLAIVIYFTNIKIPDLLTNTISMVGSITSPTAMLVIGCTLARMNLKSVFSEWRIYPWMLIKQVIIPLLLWIPFSFIMRNEVLLAVSFVLCAMPVANTAVIYATAYKADSALAARAVFITTLFALVSVPFCIWLVM